MEKNGDTDRTYNTIGRGEHTEKEEVVYRVPTIACLWTQFKIKPMPYVHMRCSCKVLDREKREENKK
jgi:hypothetical protein